MFWFVSCDLQIRQLQEVAKDLEARMNRVLDDIKRKENDLDKVRRDLRNTSPDDAAYVSSETAPVFFFLFEDRLPKSNDYFSVSCRLVTHQSKWTYILSTREQDK